MKNIDPAGKANRVYSAVCAALIVLYDLQNSSGAKAFERLSIPMLRACLSKNQWRTRKRLLRPLHAI